MLRAVVAHKSSQALSVSVCQQLPSSLIFNFPFLSSETKSPSLSVTAEKLKGIHHFKGALDDYLCHSTSFWSPDSIICVYRRVAAPWYWSQVGLLHRRKGCAGHSRVASLSLVCVRAHSNTVSSQSIRKGEWEWGGEASSEKLPVELEWRP